MKNYYALSKQEKPNVEKVKSLLTIENRASLRFGVSLGWQLGRFEFIYGSEFDEAKLAVQGIEDEIDILLQSDGYGSIPKYKSFQELSRKILTYYSVQALEKHAAILLGIAGLRIRLAGASKNQKHNLEMEKLALSAIMENRQYDCKRKTRII